MSYFTAVIARSGARWRALDVDLEDAESLDEVTELLRAARRDGPVLAVLEREDDWFALVRVDGDDDDARSFVSDLAATERSHYAQVLAPVGDVELVEYAHLRVPHATPEVEDDEDDVVFGVDDEDDDAVAPAGGSDPASDGAVDGDLATAPTVVALLAPPPWAGDPGLLADHGVEAAELVALVDDREGDPASVIAALGERCGFDELLDALR